MPAYFLDSLSYIRIMLSLPFEGFFHSFKIIFCSENEPKSEWLGIGL